jgi:hypothetical protein
MTWLYCTNPAECDRLRRSLPAGSDPLSKRRNWEMTYAALHTEMKDDDR